MSYQYGGQAVIEGVMMRGPFSLAVAVRRVTGEIKIEKSSFRSLTRWPVVGWPLVRGVFALFESLVLGLQALTFSANQAVTEEEELKPWEIFLTVVLSVGLAVLLFVVLPFFAAEFVMKNFSVWVQNLLEGLLRIGVFLLYLLGISQLAEIQRVFAYHGAEHKVINAYEAGAPLTAPAIQKFSTLHPRCGTSFLLIVLVLTIFFFAFLPETGLGIQLLGRLLLLPLIAGISYEFLRFSGRRREHLALRLLTLPGLWVQKLTTREPDQAQIEVAREALLAVLTEEVS